MFILSRFKEIACNIGNMRIGGLIKSVHGFNKIYERICKIMHDNVLLLIHNMKFLLQLYKAKAF